MGRWVSAPLAACLLALAAAGCTGRAVSAGTETQARSTGSARASQSAGTASPNPSASPAPAAVASAVSARPLPAGTAGKLPAGAYYLLAGRSLSSLNVWEVGPGGALTQLTHAPPGHGIDALAASDAGIIVGDAADGTDRLARWTRHGPLWLRHSYRGPLVQGSSPDISGHGTIGYVTPPSGSGTHRDADFAIWTQPSFTSRATVVYRQRRPLDGPVFGPHGQIAIEGWTGPQGSRQPERADLPPRRRHDAHHRGVRDPFPAGLGPPRARAGRRVPGAPGRAALPGRQAPAAAARLAAAGLEPGGHPAPHAVRHGPGHLVGHCPPPGAHGRHHHPRDADPPGGLAGHGRRRCNLRPGPGNRPNEPAGPGRNAAGGGLAAR